MMAENFATPFLTSFVDQARRAAERRAFPDGVRPEISRESLGHPMLPPQQTAQKASHYKIITEGEQANGNRCVRHGWMPDVAPRTSHHDRGRRAVPRAVGNHEMTLSLP